LSVLEKHAEAIAQVAYCIFNQADAASVPALLFVERNGTEQAVRGKPGFFARHSGADVAFYLLLEMVVQFRIEIRLNTPAAKHRSKQHSQSGGPTHDDLKSECFSSRLSTFNSDDCR
jgi:hypothetical protein